MKLEKEIQYFEKGLIQMRWKKVFIVTAIAGVFGIGAMITPIGEPSLTSNAAEPDLAKVSVESDEFICPMYNVAQVRGAGMGHYFAGTMLEVLSEKLGMSVDEIHSARYEGKSIAQLAEEKNVSVEELKAALLEKRKTELEKLVADGVITQQRMDIMLENMDVMIEGAIQRENVGPMHGQRGRMNHHMGGRWNAQANN